MVQNQMVPEYQYLMFSSEWVTWIKKHLRTRENELKRNVKTFIYKKHIFWWDDKKHKIGFILKQRLLRIEIKSKHTSKFSLFVFYALIYNQTFKYVFQKSTWGKSDLFVVFKDETVTFTLLFIEIWVPTIQ